VSGVGFLGMIGMLDVFVFLVWFGVFWLLAVSLVCSCLVLWVVEDWGLVGVLFCGGFVRVFFMGFVSFVFVFLVVGCHVCVVWFWWWFLVLRRGWVSGVGFLGMIGMLDVFVFLVWFGVFLVGILKFVMCLSECWVFERSSVL